MKRIILFLVVSITFFSCLNKTEKQYDVPQKIIVAGKIDNYDPSEEIIISVNRLGFRQERVWAKTDIDGNFMATFESYIPLNAWVVYKTNFLVLLHPNDSLFIHFDGKFNDRPELLESINFGGDAAKTNQYAAKFQQMYFSNEIYYDWDKKRKAEKEYDTDQYLQYLDTIQQKGMEIYNRFIAENRPDDESRRWASLFIENDYYDKISWYSLNRRQANQMNPDWDNSWQVPKGFYDRLCNRLPIDVSMFINANGLNTFHNTFFQYVDDKLKDRETNDSKRVIANGDINAFMAIRDSIKIFSFIELVPDPLLLQIMLTEFFDQKFNRQDIAVYERYRDVADAYIREPFLKEPLIQKYIQTKHRKENPQAYTENIQKEAAQLTLKETVHLTLKEDANLSVSQIMDSIYQQNKGKVIYIDFWGTWCGPCLAEMPNSNIVEHEFKDKDVAFVYICLESEEKQWKAAIDKFELGGQHYLLSNKQSAEIRKLFSLASVPFYILIDKYGVNKEWGSHLRPLTAREKIKEMLK